MTTSRVEVHPLVTGGDKPRLGGLGGHCRHWLTRVGGVVDVTCSHLRLGQLSQLASVDVLVGVAGGRELGQLGQGVASLASMVVALDHARVGIDH